MGKFQRSTLSLRVANASAPSGPRDGYPSRPARHTELLRDRRRRSTFGRYDENFRRSWNMINVGEFRPHPVGDLLTVRRKARTPTVIDDSPRLASQGRDDVDAASIAL